VRNSSQSGTQGATGSKNVGRTYSKRAGKRRGLSEDVRANAGRGSVRGGTSIPGRVGTGGPVSGELLQGTSQSRGSKFKSIYIRGHEGKGGRTVGLAQPGTPRQDTATAYQQVVARYVRTAHAALDRARVPPSLRSYVRKYFTVVSH
jgi:hypothetical protein